jgi:DNA-binding LytR/AlgR family response regulator
MSEHKIRVLVVEDNIIIAESIRETLMTNGIEVLAVLSSGEDAIQFLKKNTSIDLILMDVHLDGALDGISTASLILKENRIPLIYLTDFTDKQTVDRAKKTLPANFLSKPFNAADLVRAIEIAFTNFSTQPSPQTNSAPRKVFVRTDTKFIRIESDEIVFLEADRSYCHIITTREKLLMSNSMNHVHEQLGDHRFIKVHRSFVVNMDKVKEVNGNVITLDGGHLVQMGREYRDAFLEKLRIIR